jgi:hypothetical protein
LVRNVSTSAVSIVVVPSVRISELVLTSGDSGNALSVASVRRSPEIEAARRRSSSVNVSVVPPAAGTRKPMSRTRIAAPEAVLERIVSVLLMESLPRL